VTASRTKKPRNPAGKGPGRAKAAHRSASKAVVRELEAHYERVMLASNAGIWDWDVAKDEFYVSPRFLEMGGFPPGTTFSGREDFMRRWIIHPEDRDKWQQAVRTLFASRDSRAAMEVRVIVHGATHWRRLEGICFRDASGKVVRWTGSSTDITDRKRAEEARQFSEERYALAIRASGEGHWDWKIDTDEFYASPRYLEIGGFPPDMKYTGRADVVDRIPFHPEDRPAYERAVAAHFAGETPRVDIVIRILPRGEERWLRVIGLCSRDVHGKPTRWAGSVSDITEAKLAEEALRQSEGRYERAMLASEAGFWDWDVVNDVYFASPRMLEMGGLPRDTRITSRQDYMSRVATVPEDLERWLQAVKRLFASGDTRVSMELRVMVNGEMQWHAVDGMCFRDGNGKVVRFTGSSTNVTQRKRAEEALRLSEERYALAMEASEEGHFDWNVRTDEIFASTHMKQLLGVPADVEYRTRTEMSARVRYHPGELDRLNRRNREVLESGSLQDEFEYRILRGDEVRWLERRWKILRDADGAALRVIGVLTDITERKQVLETLTESEARFRSVIEFAPVAIALTIPRNAKRPAGVLEVNHEFSRMFGFTPDEVRGKELRTLLAPGDLQDNFAVNSDAIFAGHKVEKEVVRQRKDGSRILVHLTGVPIRLHDETPCLLLMYRDLTERERATKVLRESESRIRTLVELNTSGFWEQDENFRYTAYVYPQDMAGYKKEEGFGKTQWEMSGDPKPLSGSWADHQADLAAHRPYRDFEYSRVRTDGTIGYYSASGVPIFDDQGMFKGYYGVSSDITERKRVDEALRRAQSMEALGTLAGGIAHDFNNILGGILGYGEMAMRDAKEGTRLRRDLDSIMAAGERGRALVDRVLAFSRSGVAERAPVCVEAVVREAIDQIAATLPANVSIMPRLRAGRAAILGDSTQVHQVVMNLATNAVQAMAQGGVIRIVLDTAHLVARHAKVGVIAPGDYVVLKVIDSGTGIPANVLERMFDPFFTTKEVGVGSGLGLSLVHGIVANVGGAIDIETEVGKGTTFSVYLRRSGDAPEKQLDEDRPLPRGEGQRVLVVDDEEPLVRLATETLERLGYAPVGFTSSAAALAAFSADPGSFDAILTDERMPGLSGSALIRELRAIRDAIPVVLMSGYLGMESVDADVVVRKPLSARDLAASIARALQA
jgi:PAS domain S-box-containing protein